MIKQFDKLTENEIELLLKAPVLVSVLAASGDHEISKEEKAEAIKLAHLKTFTAVSLLLPYYNEVENNFKTYFESIVKKYVPFDDFKREELKKEIGALNTVIAKLDKNFAEILHKSLSGYAEHVRKADRGFLLDFILPIPITGFND